MMARHTAPLAALLGAVVLGLAPACATTPENGEADRTGCWYFERDAAAEALRLPWGVRLTPDSLTGWPALERLPGVRRATTLAGPGDEAGHPFGYWRPLAGDSRTPDSLEIGYPAGGGLVLRLHGGTDRVAGTASPVGDAVAPGAAAPQVRRVALTRARCPAG
ncbi:MAG TPA: hypothetical protein VK936_06760 [Longimicrobiales bacterium]|nr:hypothetical protein [Longimicrobiales bacterium]